MTNAHSFLVKILISAVMLLPYILLSNPIDDDIAKYAAMAKEKSDMILAQTLSNENLKKYDTAINGFILKIIASNNTEVYYKIICSNLKFAFLQELNFWLKNKNNNATKRTVIINLFKLHELLIDNKYFSDDELLQNLLSTTACREKFDIVGLKDIIKKNVLSGSLAPIFSEINDLHKDSDIEKYFNASTVNIFSLNVNHLTLYQFSMVAIQARHGNTAALEILIHKLNLPDLNNAISVKYVPRLLCYTNQPEAIMQMLNIYRKPDIRPSKEDSLYNSCACVLSILISGFPPGNAFLGIIGDKVKIEQYQKWIRENKDNYTINDVPISKNGDFIHGVIKSTLKNYMIKRNQD